MVGWRRASERQTAWSKTAVEEMFSSQCGSSSGHQLTDLLRGKGSISCNSLDEPVDPGIRLDVRMAEQHAQIGISHGSQPGDAHVGQALFKVVCLEISSMLRAYVHEVCCGFDGRTGFGSSARALVTNDGQKLCFIHASKLVEVISTPAAMRKVGLSFG